MFKIVQFHATAKGADLIAALNDHSIPSVSFVKTERQPSKNFDLDMTRLSRALVNTKVEALFFKGSDLGDARLVSICKALRQNTHNTLTKFNVEQNNIGDAGAVALADLIASSISLRKLGLMNNNIGLPGTKAICAAMARNDVLFTLSLRGNKLGADCAVVLADMLKKTEHLHSLNLQNNKIGDTGALALAEALRENTSLRNFDLSNNQITNVGAEAVYETLVETKAAIHYLHMQENDEISPELVRNLSALLVANRANAKSTFNQLLTSGQTGPWRRSKLMVVGEGRAGKTATVRAMLQREFDPEWKSTIGVSTTEMKTSSSNNWTVEPKENFTVEFVNHIAASNLYASKPAKPKPAAKKRVEEVVVPTVEESKETVVATPVPEPAPVEKKTVVVPKTKAVDKKVAFEASRLHRYNKEMLFDAHSDRDAIRMSIWDYGGQTVFYTLHHLFLTKYGVYLLVFDMTAMVTDPEGCSRYLNFWLHSIRLHASESPVVIAGTCLDKLSKGFLQRKEGQVQKKLALVSGKIGDLVKQFPQVVQNEEEKLPFWPISNKAGVGIEELRGSVQSVAKTQPFVQTQVAVKWMRCLDEVLGKFEAPVVSLTELRELVKAVDITSPEELDSMLHLLHEFGIVLYFSSTETLKSLVIIDAQWAVDQIGQVIRDKKIHKFDTLKMLRAGLIKDTQLLFENALASKDLLLHLWGPDHVNYMLDLMQHLMLLSSWKFASDELYLVPSMVVDSKTYTAMPSAFSFMFKFEFLPLGIFERIICLSIEYSSSIPGSAVPQLWTHSAKLFIGKESCIHISVVNDNSIVVEIENETEVADVVYMLGAMLQKVRADLFVGKAFAWETLVTTDSGLISLSEAKEKKISPWFKDPTHTTEAVPIDNFLDMFA